MFGACDPFLDLGEAALGKTRHLAQKLEAVGPLLQPEQLGHARLQSPQVVLERFIDGRAGAVGALGNRLVAREAAAAGAVVEAPQQRGSEPAAGTTIESVYLRRVRGITIAPPPYALLAAALPEPHRAAHDDRGGVGAGPQADRRPGHLSRP